MSRWPVDSLHEFAADRILARAWFELAAIDDAKDKDLTLLFRPPLFYPRPSLRPPGARGVINGIATARNPQPIKSIAASNAKYPHVLAALSRRILYSMNITAKSLMNTPGNKINPYLAATCEIWNNNAVESRCGTPYSLNNLSHVGTHTSSKPKTIAPKVMCRDRKNRALTIEPRFRVMPMSSAPCV